MKKFEDMIAKADWSEIGKLNDPNEAYNTFSNQFSLIYNKCFPLKKSLKQHKFRKPWISKGLVK